MVHFCILHNSCAGLLGLAASFEWAIQWIIHAEALKNSRGCSSSRKKVLFGHRYVNLEKCFGQAGTLYNASRSCVDIAKADIFSPIFFLFLGCL